jgi:hypothetical protein
MSDRNISAASWLTILVSSSVFVPMAVTRVQKGADASWLEPSEGDFIVDQIPHAHTPHATVSASGEAGIPLRPLSKTI